MFFFNAPPPPPPVVYTPPEVCEYLPEGDWEACEAPKEWNDFCWSLTNYWPFNEDGELEPLNGQADEDPTTTAVGYRIFSPLQANEFVSGPLPLISNGYYTYACFYGEDCFPIWDTFGDPIYQAGGFWHPGHQAKVIGIDIFTDEPTYQLICRDEQNPNRVRLDIYKDGQPTN